MVYGLYLNKLLFQKKRADGNYNNSMDTGLLTASGPLKVKVWVCLITGIVGFISPILIFASYFLICFVSFIFPFLLVLGFNKFFLLFHFLLY